MKVMILGGGGREHALAWQATQSPLVTRLAVVQDNPGFPSNAAKVTGDPVDWARENGVGLALIGPEAPLADGVADRLRQAGIPTLGPDRAAAQLESSKAFAKAFMDRHRIPTARWSVHEDAASAREAVTGPCVVKADGLAAGKGVLVADSAEQAIAAIEETFSGRFGAAGSRVVIEERLTGPELSVIALCDGKKAVPLLPCRDHKRRFDADQGPNTGGMGAICPPSDASDAILQQVLDDVLTPTVQGMAAEGNPFRGVLYAGLMLTSDGPRVLEFNVRFGDPECQPLMMMADEDLIPWFLASANGALPDRPIQWRGGASCCVVMVSEGYPGRYPMGFPITGIPAPTADRVVFFAGARRDGGHVVTRGGRVLGVTAWGEDLDAARANAYAGVAGIRFQGAQWRTDIGQ
ncbi:MAG: phosphoribosylamine--glycine ligase [Myxococcota bacterium]